MQDTRRRLIVILAGLAGSGCAVSTAPHGYLPAPAQAAREVRGGWVEVDRYGSDGTTRLEGELIAVTADSLWILDASGLSSVPTDVVGGGQLTWYDSEAGRVAGLSLLGTVSTASNGVFLVFTAPMWIIGGSIASGVQSQLPRERIPAGSWAELAAYARFPAGMPPGVELRGLRLKPGLGRFSPDGAFLRSMLVPGLGQITTGRPKVGLAFMAAHAGALAVGYLSDRTEILCAAPVENDCPSSYAITAHKSRPYYSAGLVIASAITLASAIEARFGAIRANRLASDGRGAGAPGATAPRREAAGWSVGLAPGVGPGAVGIRVARRF